MYKEKIPKWYKKWTKIQVNLQQFIQEQGGEQHTTTMYDEFEEEEQQNDDNHNHNTDQMEENLYPTDYDTLGEDDALNTTGWESVHSDQTTCVRRGYQCSSTFCKLVESADLLRPYRTRAPEEFSIADLLFCHQSVRSLFKCTNGNQLFLEKQMSILFNHARSRMQFSFISVNFSFYKFPCFCLHSFNRFEKQQFRLASILSTRSHR